MRASSLLPARTEWLVLVSALSPLWFCAQDATPSAQELAFACFSFALLCALDREATAGLIQKPWLRRALCLVVGFGIAVLLLGKSVDARWWIIDDHEIADALMGGRARRLRGLWDILSTHVEVLAPTFKWLRYRPSYYVLRYLECAIWGLNPQRWYLARIAMLGVAAACTFASLLRLSGATLASLTTILLLTPPFWRDVWCRLGPAEQYATFGAALFVAGCAGIVRALLANEVPTRRYWVLAGVGSVIASGSKENFLFIPAMLVGLFIIALWRRQTTVASWIATLLSAAYAGWIFYVVFRSVREHGATIYGAPPEVRNSAALLARALTECWAELGWVALVATAAGLARALLRRERDAWLDLLMLLGAILVPLAIYASQLLFYQGTLPVDGRYDFPALLMFTLSLCLIAAIARKVVYDAFGSAPLASVFDAGVTVALVVLIGTTGFAPLKASVVENVQRTIGFTSALDIVVQAGQAEPKRPFVFFVNHEAAYEPIVSVRTFMRAKGLKNPVYISSHFTVKSALTSTIERWQKKGRRRWDHSWPEPRAPWMFKPLSRLKEPEHALGVGFVGAPIETGQRLASFY